VWSHQDLYTNHPDISNPLTRGAHNTVFWNGIEIGPVTTALLGPKGWIKFCVENETGAAFLLNPEGTQILSLVLKGAVSYRGYQTLQTLLLVSAPLKHIEG
jgi:hypothetical protein